MSKHVYNVHTNPKTVEIALRHGIKLCIPETNTVTMQLPENYICPDVSGVRIGYEDVNTKTLISNIKGDEDASLLKRYIDLGLVQEIHLNQLDKNNNLTSTNHYFFVYEIDSSSKYKPTSLDGGPGYGIPINGHYKCQYEILLASDNYTRRMLFTAESTNIPMCEWINEFIETIEILKDYVNDDSSDADESMKEYADQFYMLNGQLYYTMFDAVGNPIDVELDASEFKANIVSIRQISCKFVNHDK